MAMNIRYKVRNRLFGPLKAENWIMDKNVRKMPGRQITRPEAERMAGLMRTGMSMKQAREKVAKEVAGKDRDVW